MWSSFCFGPLSDVRRMITRSLESPDHWRWQEPISIPLMDQIQATCLKEKHLYKLDFPCSVEYSSDMHIKSQVSISFMEENIYRRFLPNWTNQRNLMLHSLDNPSDSILKLETSSPELSPSAPTPGLRGPMVELLRRSWISSEIISRFFRAVLYSPLAWDSLACRSSTFFFRFWRSEEETDKWLHKTERLISVRLKKRWGQTEGI